MDPTLRLKGKRFDFTVPQSGPARLASGGAIYEEGERIGETAATEYAGDSLVKIEVPLLFDGFPHTNVWPDVQQVLNLAISQRGEEPPDFEATGPIPFSGMRFQAELPEWEGGFGHKGRWLVRQALTLRLIQFEDPDEISFRKGKGRKIGIGNAEPVATETLRNGETLLEVSARVYGNANRAAEIGALNGIRDIRKKLPAHKQLRLP
jgi:hypothetical protein